MLVKEDVPAAPILRRKELLNNDQVTINKIFKIYDNPNYGKIRSPRVAAVFSESPCDSNTLAPLLGADNEAILRELSYSNKQISLFIKEGIIGGK